MYVSIFETHEDTFKVSKVIEPFLPKDQKLPYSFWS